jgi:rhodanese-related sulfurtransferase
MLLADCSLFSAALALAADNYGQSKVLESGRVRSSNLVQSGEVRQDIDRNKSMVLVDVRLPAVYQQYRIPGSLNIPLSFVRTKKFLANKSVVLINQGFQRISLNSEISRLESAGFSDVAILAGGLTGWRRTGGSIDGNREDSRRSNLVSPAEFYGEQGRSGLLIVNATGKGSAGQDVVAHAVPIPFNQSNQHDFRDKLIAAAVPHSKTGLPDLLIFSENGAEYQEIENLLADIGVNIFFLEGGVAAYRDFLDQQENLKNPKTVVSGDTTCPICPKK